MYMYLKLAQRESLGKLQGFAMHMTRKLTEREIESVGNLQG